MKTDWKGWKRIYKSNTNLYIVISIYSLYNLYIVYIYINFESCLSKLIKFFKKTNANNK